MSRRRPLRCLAWGTLLLLPGGAWAYPEFQVFSQTHSGRNVNCAMCHAHPDGPDGVKAGQIGSLDSDALVRLNKARTAFEPGTDLKSPILNEFGNHILSTLGRTKFIALQRSPEKLAVELGPTSDLDSDGIPDSREFLDGTDVLDANHGDSWLLFKHNLATRKLHIVMIAVATILGLFGLTNLFRGLASATESSSIDPKDDHSHQGDSRP